MNTTSERIDDMTDLKGKKALVTGGGVGIGRSVVSELCSAGVDVVFTYRTHEPDDAFLAECRSGNSGVCEAISVDARSEESVRACVAEAAEALGGGIDILVNNVGGLVDRVPVRTMEYDFWRNVLAVNMDSMFLFTRESLKYMTSGWGRVVNVASLAGRNGGSDGSTAYATSKAGMFGFTRGLAKEVAAAGITVNAVAPGLILDTPFHETFTSPENQAKAIESIALKRPGMPVDVAGPVLWLCSEGSAFVTGATIDINGGQYFA